MIELEFIQILYKLDRKLGFSAYYQRGNEAVDITHCISPSDRKDLYIELLKKAQKEKRSNNVEWEMFAVEALGADAVFFLKMEAGLD